MNTRTLLHIGYHKTGSTFLQQHVFSNQHIGFGQLPRRKVISKRIRFAHPATFELENLRSELQQGAIALSKQGLFPVFSAEGLSGRLNGNGSDGFENQKRLQQLLPDARILIVLREQLSMLRSSHFQYVRNGGYLSLNAFAQQEGTSFRQFYMSKLCYHSLIQAYQQGFGAQNVLVLPFEMLREDRHRFLQKIADHCVLRSSIADLVPDEKVNRAMPSFGTALMRQLNNTARLTSRFEMQGNSSVKRDNDEKRKVLSRMNAIGNFVPDGWNRRLKEKQEQALRSQLDGYFSNSNRITADLTGLDLGQYGYQL